jgi:hypothetical protein
MTLIFEFKLYGIYAHILFALCFPVLRTHFLYMTINTQWLWKAPGIGVFLHGVQLRVDRVPQIDSD